MDVYLPDEEVLGKIIQSEAEHFIRRELAPRVALLQNQIDSGKGNARIHNRLGVLYARYGLFKEAKEEFQTVIVNDDYSPALLNLGNIYFLENSFLESLEYLERAAGQTPDNPRILLALVRVQYALEEYSQAERTFSRLQNLDSELAASFAFLGSLEGSTDRAADVSMLKEIILWEE